MSQRAPASPLEAVVEVAAFLAEKRIPYVVMGGLAVQYWGEPRATRDIDVTVLVPPGAEDSFIQETIGHFEPRITGADSFAKTHRILLVRASNDCPVDISLGIAGYEEEIMKRAVEITWPTGSTVRLIGVEDLIIHKCVAGRPRDLEDVYRILLRQQAKVDHAYIRAWLKQFLPLVPQDPLSIFEDALSKSEQP